jgi:hypothetical protein
MKIGDQIQLFDKTDVHLCTFTVDQVDPAYLGGTFIPTDNFETVRPLFERFDSLVSGNSLAYIDEVEDQIEELGIYGKAGGVKTDIFDIQIHGDHGSLRLQPFRAY